MKLGIVPQKVHLMQVHALLCDDQPSAVGMIAGFKNVTGCPSIPGAIYPRQTNHDLCEPNLTWLFAVRRAEMLWLRMSRYHGSTHIPLLLMVHG